MKSTNVIYFFFFFGSFKSIIVHRFELYDRDEVEVRGNMKEFYLTKKGGKNQWNTNILTTPITKHMNKIEIEIIELGHKEYAYYLMVGIHQIEQFSKNSENLFNDKKGLYLHANRTGISKFYGKLPTQFNKINF